MQATTERRWKPVQVWGGEEWKRHLGEDAGGREALPLKGGETYKPKKMTFIFTAFFLNQLFFEV